MKLKLLIALACCVAQTLVHAQVPVTAPIDTTTKLSDDLKELPDPKTISYAKDVALADKLLDKGSIYNAMAYYEEALTKNPSKTGLNLKLADGYRMLRDYKNATKYYRALVDLDTKHEDVESLYFLAMMEKYNGEYASSKAHFQQFLEIAKGHAEMAEPARKAAREIQGCDLAMKLLADKHPHNFNMAILDSNINQPFTDYAPVLKDPNTLYFGSWTSNKAILVERREKHAEFSRIYTAHKTGNKWGKSEVIVSPVNTVNYHVGNAAFSPEGNTMYYTQCTEDEKLQIRCKIYRSALTDSGWAAGKELDAAINDKNATNTEPAFGKNEAGETVLYFASDRNKGRGMDLFAAKLKADGTFEKAKPLSINTEGDEQTPFYDFQNNILYFCSDGRPGLGGLDIYKTHAENGNWTEPENMGLPINSSADDMYFYWSATDNTGFVVSNREGGYGTMSSTCCDDIYQVTPRVVHFGLKGMVFDDDTHSTLDGQDVSLLDEKTGATITTIKSAGGGFFFFNLDKGKSYKVSATKPGYFAATASTSTVGKEYSDTVSVKLVLKKMEVNKPYTLNNIYYAYDKSELTPASKAVLDTLYEILKDNPNITIELSAHTDGKGTDKYNNELSQKRAESCVKYLVKEKGIAKERITAKGYGKTMPVAPNTNPDGSDNPDGRAKNRRTEFKVTGEVKR